MSLLLGKSSINHAPNTIDITGSKSISNRLLILQALYPNLVIENLSNSDDTSIISKALASNSTEINIGHAGTAMRFLTAYYSTLSGKEVVLTGSARMQERPIKILVDALSQLGARITYLGQEGYPPLRIEGRLLEQESIRIDASVSSQYISGLMLIAPRFKRGLTIELMGNISSRPYIEMTSSLLKALGCNCHIDNDIVTIEPLNTVSTTVLQVESDWSSASYYYSMVGLSPLGTSVSLCTFTSGSIQGDSELIKIFEQFGVYTTFQPDGVMTIQKMHLCTIDHFEYDLSDHPDMAQTLAVTCLGLGIACHIKGLHSLRIKETDRLIALDNEIRKFGADVVITSHSLRFDAQTYLNEGVSIKTYGDHRMAMAFSALSIKLPLIIEDPDVVSKSYPNYWEDLKKIGIKISK